MLLLHLSTDAKGFLLLVLPSHLNVFLLMTRCGGASLQTLMIVHRLHATPLICKLVPRYLVSQGAMLPLCYLSYMCYIQFGSRALDMWTQQKLYFFVHRIIEVAQKIRAHSKRKKKKKANSALCFAVYFKCTDLHNVNTVNLPLKMTQILSEIFFNKTL